MSKFKEVPLKYVLSEVTNLSSEGTEQIFMLSKERGLIPRDLKDGVAQAESYIGYKRFQPYDFVMNKMQAWNGVFGYSTYSGLVSPDYSTFRLNGIVLSDLRFLNYLVKTPLMLEKFASASRGIGTGFNRLHPSNFLSLYAALPSLEEQRRIADYLDDKCVAIDNGITSHKEIARNIKELTKSERDLEIRGISLDAKVVGGWLGSINSKWSVIRLGQLVSFKSGAGFPDSYQGKTEGDYPFIKVGDIAGSNELGYISKANNYINSPEAKILNARVAPKGTLIFPKVGAALLGNARAILEVPSVFDNNVMGLQFKDGEIRFWYHVLRAIDMARICNPGPVPSIGAESVSNIMVPFPNTTIQNKIAKRLDALDKSHSRVLEINQRAIEKLNEYKTSLITAAVTGTFDVTTGRSVA